MYKSDVNFYTGFYYGDLWFDLIHKFKSYSHKVFFKMDDMEYSQLFSAYKKTDGSGEYSYSIINENYDILKIANISTARELALVINPKNKYHLTEKEYDLYRKRHNIYIKIDDEEISFENIYICPFNEMYFYKFSKARINENGKQVLSLDDCGLDLGDIGTTAILYDNSHSADSTTATIIKKTETENDGWDYEIEVELPPKPNDTLIIEFENNPTCKRKDADYWYTYYAKKAYLYDLVLPKLYIKTKEGIFRVVVRATEETDREITMKTGETTITKDFTMYIKTKFGILQVELKKYLV